MSTVKQNVKTFLTQGLQGYATGSKISETSRAGFVGKTNHLITDEGGVYHDEWFVPTHLGGGQELVKFGQEMYTRVYAGGTPSPEKLAELGIKVEDVGKYLKNKIAELGEQTRLFENCKPDSDGDWQYQYEVLVTEKSTDLTVGVESIFYKEVLVHIHPFILSPVI